MHDGAQTHIQFDEHVEDRHAHGGLLRVDDVGGFFLVFPIPPVGAAADADRQSYLDAGLPAPVGILDDLMALALGTPGQDRAYQLAAQDVVDVLADADDLATI